MFTFKNSVEFALLTVSARSASGWVPANNLPQGGTVADDSAGIKAMC